MASSSKISNPSTLRVFENKNRRFILELTLHSLDQGKAEVENFISLFEYEQPLAAPWYHIHDSPSELTT